MNILVAEDEFYVSSAYEIALEKKGHTVLKASDGNECINIYVKHLNEFKSLHGSGSLTSNTPFDAVILDYKMPEMDGMEVAKRILALNPRQRIIFASAYVRDTLEDSVKNLGQIVELLQKPFEVRILVDTVEDKEIYEGLKALNARIDEIKKFNLTHDEIRDLYEGLKKIMKGRIK